MNAKEIQALLELVDQFDIEEFEMERSGVRIRIRRAPRDRISVRNPQRSWGRNPMSPTRKTNPNQPRFKPRTYTLSGPP